MKQIAFFASGSGTNFQAVIDAVKSDEINARICGLITNKTGIEAIERAKKYDIPTKVFNPASFNNNQNYRQQLLDVLKDWNPDLIVLAGYLLKIPAEVIRAYSGKIINIHPSLLPKFGGRGFYGIKVHEAVIRNNEKETGCSVHIVTEQYDEGPVLAQRTVPVHPADTPEVLARRVLEQEHKLLQEVIKNYLTNSNL